MAVSALVKLDANTWTEITGGDATTITAIHRGGAEVLIQATTGSAPSASSRLGLPITGGNDRHRSGFLKKTITELSMTADVDRVFAFAVGGPAMLFVEDDSA